MRSDRSAVPIEWRSRLGWVMSGLLCPGLALCGDGAALDLTGHWAGRAALAIFAVAYALVIAEETLRLRKSKPVMVAANACGAYGPFGDITVRQKGVVCRSSSSWTRLRKQSMLRLKRALARCRALLVPCS